MTTDRDRVEAWTAYCEADPEAGEVERRAFCTGWQAAADALAPPPTGLCRVRHVKRGTTYTVLGEAEAQIAQPELKNAFGNARLLSEGDRVVVYQSVGGKLWARFPDEMWDGRFEPIADAPAPSSEAAMSDAERIAAPAAEVERLRGERDTALGIVRGWRERAEAAEKERDEARKYVERLRAGYEETIQSVQANRHDLARARDAAEKERDEARAALEATEDETAHERANTAERARDSAKSLFEKTFRELTKAKAEIAKQNEDLDGAEARLARARADALEEAAKVAEEQPYYWDTHTGMRQQWVKDEIARKVRALADSEPAGRAALAAEGE